MLTKISLTKFGENLLKAFKRFPLTVIGVFVLTALVLLELKTNVQTEIDERTWYFLPFATLFSLSFYLFTENNTKCLLRNLLNMLLVGLFAWFSFTLGRPITDSEAIRLALLLLAAFLSLFFAQFLTDKAQENFWENAKETAFNLITAAIFGAVLLGGLSLAVLSLDKLFGVEIPNYYYGYLSTLSFVLFAPLYFISTIPRIESATGKAKISYPKFIKILALYILLPILALYVAILYGYLFKIIATWTLPNGWLSWLVSVLGVSGFITLFLLSPLSYDNATSSTPPDDATKPTNNKTQRVAAFFSRFFPLLLLPLLMLMLVGIVRRLSDYGLTINRLLVLLLNLWMFGVSFYLIISKNKNLKMMFISFAAICLLAATGPWSVMSVTRTNMQKQFADILTEAGWEKNSSSTILNKLDEKKRTRLHDIATYLQEYYNTKEVNYKGYQVGLEHATKDIVANKNQEELKYFYHDANQISKTIAINGFNSTIYLEKNYDENLLHTDKTLKVELKGSTLKIEHNQLKSNIALQPTIEKLLNHKNETQRNCIVIENPDFKLIITNLSGETKNKADVKINSFKAFLFLK